MEELLIAVFAGFLAGALLNKLSNKVKKVPVFKNDKLKNSKDILSEATKAKDVGADSASILLAFGAIESELRKISGHKESTYSIQKMLAELESEKAIDPHLTSLIKQLAKIRNETAHGANSKKFSDTKVTSYLERSKTVLNELADHAYKKSI
ncbi:DUF4145 domain-containing protein [Pseudoalteromonas tetraodonis]|uniref:DUF4145 domain-containing protein n=1 Tax=Pseudoalteromonas tetraodonis TaxID=43659 RepID=UPI003D025547